MQPTKNVVVSRNGERGAPAGREPVSPVPTPFRGRVLLVEDNPVNLGVTKDILELLGMRVEVAANGREAVKAALGSAFDLILMDCQMPEMDGYDATRALRRAEERGDERWGRRPIVAMTANAMEGDREECLAAGMDDYLAKPFRLQQMEEILARWLPADPSGDRLSPAGGDRAKARASVGGDAPAGGPGGRPESRFPDLDDSSVERAALENLRTLERHGAAGAVRRTVEFYLEDAPGLLDTAGRAAEIADLDGVRRAAHSLKSMSRNVGAQRLAGLCERLEALGRKGRADGAVDLVAQMRSEYGRVRIALADEFAREVPS